MRFILLALILLLACCKSKTEQQAESKNPTLPPLPIATQADKLTGEKVQFIELQHSDESWNVDGCVWIDNEEQLIEKIKSSKDTMKRDGISPRALIKAAPDTPFRKIRYVIRSCAAAGIDTVMFATKKHTSSPDKLGDAHEIHLAILPSCGTPPVIEPMHIKISSNNEVYINTGAAQELVDPITSDHHLPGLNNRLESYAAAARAGAAKPHVLAYVDPKASHQRFINLLDALKRNDIKYNASSFVSEAISTPPDTDCRKKFPIPPHLPRPPVERYPGP